MLDRRSRHRIHGMLADVVLLELWLANEVSMDEATEAELSDAFSRVQARMLVVQSILWPQEEDEWLSDVDSNSGAEDEAAVER